MAGQIFADGPVTAPAVYTVPGSSEIIPIAVQAELDGTSASGDFVPTLIFRSQAGHVIARVPVETTVAAGGSAEVSWFPGVKRSAAAAATGAAAWFFGRRTTNFTVPTTSPSLRIPFTHFVTSDPTVFTVSQTTNPNDTVNCLQSGIYIAMGQLAWGGILTYPRDCHIVTSFFGVSPVGTTPVSDTTTASTAVGNIYTSGDIMFAVTQSVPGTINLFAKNYDGSNHIVTQALYFILYLPNSTLIS